MTTLEDHLKKLAADFSYKSTIRTEADIQAGIRSFLLAGPLGLDESKVVKLEVPTKDGTRRRIDIEVGQCVIEVKKDIRNARVRSDAEEQLQGYVETQSRKTGSNFLGILTDGMTWNLYRLIEGHLTQVDSITVKSSDPDVDALQVWLESILATAPQVTPTPSEIETRLGAESPSFRADQKLLRSFYKEVMGHPEVKLKRHLWARLLRTALGTSFHDDEQLFVDHTLLVLEANIIAHAVTGISLEVGPAGAKAIINGTAFTEAQIGNVVEADFFDWVLKAAEGEEFVGNLIRKLKRFSWENVEHDVLKVLYESAIGADTRKSLGEYYTPDWLAERLVLESVSDPLQQRVMDPACGSGTFLFHAVRHHLARADDEGLDNKKALDSVTSHVFGMDIHPVSVVLARVTYLLAIGFNRLSSPRGSLNVPVYLGDSMQWIKDATTVDEKVMRVEVDTADLAAHESQGALFSAGRLLSFPLSTIDDPATFDRLISELATLAQTYTDPRNQKPQVTPVLRRYGVVDSEDRRTLTDTFKLLCELNANNENHIWGYYVRNQVRPLWFSLPNRRMDVLIGNPPWVAYKYMTDAMQRQFKRFCQARNLWAGKQSSAHQDLVGLFIARCVEQYLNEAGEFAFVVPKAVLSRAQYDGFRSGRWLTLMGQSTETDVRVRADFATAWDLEKIRPPMFPVPSAAIFGHRSDNASRLPEQVKVVSGNLKARSVKLEQARKLLKEQDGISKGLSLSDVPKSPYADIVFQGAIIAPRFLLYVTEREANKLGGAEGLARVQSMRTPLEQKPWAELPGLTGQVEKTFVRDVILGSTLVPYRTLPPWRAVLPIAQSRLFGEEEIADYAGLSTWWNAASEVWEAHKGAKSRLSLMQQINYQGKLSKQLARGKYRVVHVASGTTLAATFIEDPDLIIDNSLFWLTVHDRESALYLTSVLNSKTTLNLVSTMQSRGLFGARHFNKYVWHLPIPRFNESDTRHVRLAELAETASTIAKGIDLTNIGFKRARGVVRDALYAAGVGFEIDELVSEVVK
ncbi:N-6 DNA methylase [Streptomyces sp. S-2]|uniref:N-6 DNA methylase n=1 Tax=Streptomyces sp. S-2 TaxID=2675217 RepID=UPI0014367D3D|nr:N-6 DNA methylase [Streptomyces sp. S-2]MBV7250464.1 N-6 DNA methylase [Streptomyces sp. S-2]